MRAIPNKVVIGDEDAPILTFYNDSIKNVTEETAVSLIGDELFIDQFVPVVSYNLLTQQIRKITTGLYLRTATSSAVDIITTFETSPTGRRSGSTLTVRSTDCSTVTQSTGRGRTCSRSTVCPLLA